MPAQGIKVTQGITGWSWMGVLIISMLRHLDVCSTLPGVARDTKGVAVLHIKGNVSWVQIAVTQIGFYLLGDCRIKMFCPSTRGLGG